MSLVQYAPSVEADALLATWWLRMRDAGDLDRTLYPDAHPLSGFLALMQAPRTVLLEVDADGVAVGAWFDPFMGGAAMGLWVRPSWRQRPEGLAACFAVWDAGLRRWPVLLGVTRQPELLAPHQRVGYTVLGEVPHLWAGEPAWLLALTREAYAPVRARWQRRLDRRLLRAVAVA